MIDDNQTSSSLQCLIGNIIKSNEFKSKKYVFQEKIRLSTSHFF